MKLFVLLVGEVVKHYKKKNTTPRKDAYDYLVRDDCLNDSSYLDFLAENAKTKDQIDCIHEHLNNFNDKVDVYGVPNYMKLSQKLIEKRGEWE